MARQPLSAHRPALARRAGGWRLALVIAGALAIATLAVTCGGAWLLRDGFSPFDAAALVLTFANLFWTSAAAITAAAGAVCLWTRRSAAPQNMPLPSARTALIFPLYNEDFGHVSRNAEDLLVKLGPGALSAFEFFFLSDSNVEACIESERALFADLVRRYPGAPLYYRRRAVNTERKVGNIADFVTNWGARYDFMVVFDADSVMTPQALATLVSRMQASPNTAIIQTIPKIINARSVYARMQQFALNAYGPLFGAGIAWWSGDAGNYWGHNAIVRVRAFARHAGLPTLPGKAPFGGPLLSHDFVEAALLRRAGWRIEMAPEIEGSFEQVPPTLIDVAARDRRWAQGNLQHFGVICARGFDWVSRAHIACGIMSYLSSVFWFCLALCGMAIALDTRGVISDRGADLAGAALTGIVMTTLLAPKIMALVLWSFGKLPGATKDCRFTVSVAAETIIAAVIAPILMVNQTAAVAAALVGRDIGWREQVRERLSSDFAEAVRWFAPHNVVALLILGTTTLISPMAGLWAAATTMSLIASAFISHVLAKHWDSKSWLWQT